MTGDYPARRLFINTTKLVKEREEATSRYANIGELCKHCEDVTGRNKMKLTSPEIVTLTDGGPGWCDAGVLAYGNRSLAEANERYLIWSRYLGLNLTAMYSYYERQEKKVVVVVEPSTLLST